MIKNTADQRKNVVREEGEEGKEAEGIAEKRIIETEETKGARPALGPAEWLLSLAIPAAAYLYISLLGWPTVLQGWLWQAPPYRQVCWRIGGGWLIFAIVFAACGLLYLRAAGRKPARGSWGYLALMGAVALWFPICLREDQNIFIYMLIYLHGVAVYWLLAAADNRSDVYLNERGVRDLGRGFGCLTGTVWLSAERGSFRQQAPPERETAQKGWRREQAGEIHHFIHSRRPTGGVSDAGRVRTL